VARRTLGALSRAYLLELGLKADRRGYVTLYHGTTKAGAARIRRTNTLCSAGEPHVYVTSDKTAGGYGDGTVVKVKVHASRLDHDDEFPDGRNDFRIALRRPGTCTPIEVVTRKRRKKS